MRLPLLLATLGVLASNQQPAAAHDLSGGSEHPHYVWSENPPGVVQVSALRYELAQAAPSRRPAASAPAPVSAPAQARVFAAFAPQVNVRWDERFLFVEGN